jgi:hypothetical protein
MRKKMLRIKFESTWVMPDNDGKSHIDILLDKNDEYSLKYVRPDAEGKKITSLIPVSQKTMQALLIELSKINIPAFPAYDMGCDGGFTELEMGDYAGHTKLRWWSAPPAGWEPLDEWVDKIRKLLEADGMA